MFGSGSFSDPFAFALEPGGGIGKFSLRDKTGKVLANPNVLQGQRVLCLGCAGQSNIANTAQNSYATVNPGNVLNLNIWDGALYQGQNPFLGASNGTGTSWLGRLGDKLIASGQWDYVVLATIAMGASAIAEHAVGGPENLKYRAAYNRMKEIGTMIGADLNIDAWLLMQGEADKDLGTSQANWQARFQSLRQSIRARGDIAPMFVAKCTYINGASSPTIRAAQAAVINSVDVFAGPDTDTLTGANRWDTTHLGDTGGDNAATMWRDTLISAKTAGLIT
ncbi:hypothetical protein HFO65_15950 [Rhizobium laguerreae]|uniref:sialate O-acetylesterase n=1 Tax=Rhizobium laguerreae TaxID=1076926 RepID=UPI001C8FD35A|nr:sialate O-acetylesterase [Rhizobium laguerreae]MBY3162124.1 hypothetical protein [Rhizobium laguerreae]